MRHELVKIYQQDAGANTVSPINEKKKFYPQTIFCEHILLEQTTLFQFQYYLTVEEQKEKKPEQGQGKKEGCHLSFEITSR